jgi:hypothetical protein
VCFRQIAVKFRSTGGAASSGPGNTEGVLKAHSSAVEIVYMNSTNTLLWKIYIKMPVRKRKTLGKKLARVEKWKCHRQSETLEEMEVGMNINLKTNSESCKLTVFRKIGSFRCVSEQYMD